MRDSLIVDPRLRSVPWRDLVRPTRSQAAIELLLPLPWFAASQVVAQLGYWPLALPLSFFFYLAGLRQVHNAFHHAVGVPRWADQAIMLVLSGLMLGSMHAVRFNHLRHHKLCLADGDVEGDCARRGAIATILLGPVFPIRTHWHALRRGSSRERGCIAAELLVVLSVIAVACALPIVALRYHVLAMAAGQSLSAFFCVWTVHHGCDGERVIARTIRNRLRSFITLEMFYHLEHHLFPAVPTCNLAELARRLDEAVPELERRTVL